MVGAAPNSKGFAGAAGIEPLAAGGSVFSTPTVADIEVGSGDTALNGIRCKYP